MGGLLYKDFASVKGKKIVTVLFILTAVMMILKIVGVRTDLFSVLNVVNDNGEHINLFDTITLEAVWFLIILGCAFINMWVSKITEYDEKKKSVNYYLSMPIDKSTFVASKFVFFGICYYVVFSLVVLWSIISAAFVPEGFMLDMIMLTQAFSTEIIGLALLVSGIELTIYLIFGRARGQFFKTAFINLLGMIVAGYLLFGNLRVFENWDIDNLISWCEKNSFLLMLVTTVSPLISLGLYFLCYRISVKVFDGKEYEYE